jgi:hypothetical protein
MSALRCQCRSWQIGWTTVRECQTIKSYLRNAVAIVDQVIIRGGMTANGSRFEVLPAVQLLSSPND